MRVPGIAPSEAMVLALLADGGVLALELLGALSATLDVPSSASSGSSMVHTASFESARLGAS